MFQKFYELGLSVFPCKSNTKIAIAEKWQTYCNVLPPKEKVDLWEKHHKTRQFNFALACGPASNIIVIDIDTDEPSILKNVPPSPLVRGGRAGRQARFFQYSEEIPSVKFSDDKKPLVEILTTGRYCMIPPSIHPDTEKPYPWLSKDTLETITAKDLPTLSIEQINQIEAAVYALREGTGKTSLRGFFQKEDPKRESPEGSQERLKTLASALIFKNTSLDEAVLELLNYDKAHHEGPGQKGYFFEQGRVSDQKGDPYTSAIAFYSSILESINKNRARKGEPPIVPGSLEPTAKNITVSKEKLNTLIDEKADYPEGRGLLKKIQNYLNGVSTSDCPVLALGGGLPVLAAISSNRFQGVLGPYSVTPNVYILNIAGSGTGKEATQRFCRRILEPFNLCGSGGYQSGPSIVQGLPKQQERLDVIDEVTSLLKMTSGSKAHESQVLDILCQLYSQASSAFQGLSSLQHGHRAFACQRPHVSILGSTTSQGFKDSVTLGMGFRGLMPRFAIFYQRPNLYREARDLEESEALFKEINKEITEFVETHPKVEVSSGMEDFLKISEGKGYKTRGIKFTKEAYKEFYKFAESNHNRAVQMDQDGEDDREAAFLARHAEIAAKFALLDSIALFRDQVEIDSIQWAISLVSAQHMASKNLYSETNAENETQALANKILKAIRSFHMKHERDISHAELVNRVRAQTKWVKESAIEHLVESGQVFIKEMWINKRQRPTRFYSLFEPEETKETPWNSSQKEPIGLKPSMHA